ncbi:MAG: hypothetical protein KAH17_02435 [Bacteroidales bacterium]|nr:hypothetical protein [Bacteroidales bacterium]
MALSRLSLLALTLAVIVSACESEFDPTAPKGSTPYVMCILNAKDSAQYVRVQRSYISHENAYNFSSNSDSLYYTQDEIEVFLTQFDTLDGSMMDEPIRLYPSYEISKDTGAFAVEGHYLFKTTEPIYSEFDYELSINFPKEDKKISSRITPLGTWNFQHAFNTEVRKTRYSWYRPERIDYFLPLTPNNHQQITRFLYTEMSSNDTVDKYIEYFHDYDAYAEGGEGLEGGLDFLGDDFLLRFIQKEVELDPDKRRIVQGIDFMIQIADSNLITYQMAGDPAGTYMYSPEFSNIRNGGVGLFASRYKFTIFGKALKPEELDSISLSDLTRELNFADSKGEFHGGGIE